jgi:hypothetical protein
MSKLHVTIYYESVEPGGFPSTRFEMKKTFNIKIPNIECKILLENDAIKYIRFKDVTYDPKNDEYYVVMYTSENVHRYYHGNAYEIMSKEIDHYKKHDWKCELVEKGT